MYPQNVHICTVSVCRLHQRRIKVSLKALCDTSEVRSCVKVEVAVRGSVPNKPTVSVDVKQHPTNLYRTVRESISLLCKCLHGEEEHSFRPN